MKRRLFAITMVLTLMAIAYLIPATAAYADDGNTYEVGVWWINQYSSPYGVLTQCDDSAEGFKNKLVDYSWNSVYDISDSSVYERQFKRVGLGNGDDDSYTDAVDLAFFSGHGDIINSVAAAVMSDTTHDDQYVAYSDCQWGDVDLEWMLFDCCYILNDASDNYWASTMNGLHLICGAVTTINDYDNGRHVVDLLIDDGWWDWARTIKASWFNGLDYDQPSGVVLNVIGETDTCGDDYIWGQGSGACADPTHDGYFSYWTYTC